MLFRSRGVDAPPGSKRGESRSVPSRDSALRPLSRSPFLAVAYVVLLECERRIRLALKGRNRPTRRSARPGRTTAATTVCSGWGHSKHYLAEGLGRLASGKFLSSEPPPRARATRRKAHSIEANAGAALAPSSTRRLSLRRSSSTLSKIGRAHV